MGLPAAAWPAGGGFEEPGHDSLVASIKELQRSNPDGRDQWVAYTDMAGGSVKDPAKHTAEFLKAFLAHLNSGSKLAVNADAANMGEGIKLLQRKSPSFKAYWSLYCMQYGNGLNDPTRHEPDYQVKFFDYLSQQAVETIQYSTGACLGTDEPPTKKMRIDGGKGAGKNEAWGGWGYGNSWDAAGSSLWGGKGAAWGGAAGSWGGKDGKKGGAKVGKGPPLSASKQLLVDRIKGFQRLGEQQKELWSKYTDLYLGGMKDPARHEEGVLNEFCINHQVPEAEALSSLIGWGGGGAAAWAGAPAAADPLKDSLVQRIKMYQKMNPEHRELWVQFAGVTHDPARHETAKLQEFVTAYGVP